MPHDVIDNRAEKLVDHIRRILPGSQAARLAVGYFFLSGLEAIADRLANVRELRLLNGLVSVSRWGHENKERTAERRAEAL